MYHFIQENTDKRCRWRMIPANRELNLQPAFKTILSVSSDPAQIAEQGSDPDDKVKYFGPLYFDLDGKDIAKVTAEAKKLVNQLKESYFIPSNAIKIYLSGKKGFHIIVSEKLFGIPAAGKLYLPLIYKEFAMKFNLESLDEGVYSLGKGRMWRCSGVQRPDNGKYKVQITQEELNNLTEESYAETCNTARPDFAESGTIEEMPELKSFVDATFDIVKRNLKDAKREQSNLTNEDIQAIEGVPGCIELLVTEGDCADSNWNLAAMTLASYLGAKYEDRNDPEAVELVERFVVNVESGTRPSVKDRQTAMKDLLNRAYSGTIRFFAGSLFRTLGKSCGSCDLCTKKISSGEGKQANGYDANTGIRIARHATYLVGEESSKKIATFGITPEIIYTTLDEYNQEIVMEGSYRIHTELGPENGIRITIDEESWQDKRKFNRTVGGSNALFSGSETELQMLYITVQTLRVESETVIRVPVSGIVFFERDGEVYPQLVTADEAYSKNGSLAPFQYTGNPRLAPSFSQTKDITKDNLEDLRKAVTSLFQMNEDRVVIPAIGWTMACHLKTHLTHRDKGFPMLNMSGTSHTGKSSTGMILLTLNAFPYRRAPIWNSETDTIYPLEDMVTSTRTVIRLIEEANEHVAKRNWPKLVGILKSSWDEGGISKGAIKGRKVISETKENTAPIMFLSEQAFPIQAVRTRCIEVFFHAKTLSNKDMGMHHETVIKNIHALESLAKMAAFEALAMSDVEVEEIREEMAKEVPSDYTGRTAVSHAVVMVGLEFMARVVETLDRKLAEFIREKLEVYQHMILTSIVDISKAKNLSALDEIVLAIDQMAGEYDNTLHGLVSGTHYWKEGDLVYLDLRSIMPRYLRYIRGLGFTPSVRTATQLEKLIEGETYFKGNIPHPEIPSLSLTSLDQRDLADKGVNLNNMVEKRLN